MAIEFSYRVREYDPHCAVFWVSALTTGRFTEGFREIAIQLCIPGAEDQEQHILESVRRKLSDESSGKWLLIIDNADDKRVLFNSDSTRPDNRRLYDYLPRSRHGLTLVTTRSRDVAVDVARKNIIELQQMTPSEAKHFVSNALIGSNTLQDTIITDFLERMTYLPLAIVQGVAFMNKKGTSLAAYVEIVKRTDYDLIRALSEDFEDANRDSGAVNPVVTTWYISFEQLKRDEPLAAEFLSFVACVLPQNIPRTMFPPCESQLAEESAIGTLRGYQFLQNTNKPDYYNMHVLIHLVTKTWLQREHQWLSYIEKVAQRLNTLMPWDSYTNWERYVDFLPHATQTTSLSEARTSDSAHELLHRVAGWNRSIGQFAASEALFRLALKWPQARVSKSWIEGMRGLGTVMMAQGKYSGCEKMFRRLIAVKSQLNGQEHPNTLESLTNLASLYNFEQRLTEAAQLGEKLIETKKRVLGPEHPDTLKSQVNLAIVYAGQERWREAEELNKEVLETNMRVLDHERDEIQVNLAFVYWKQGRLEEAEKLGREALGVSLILLGEEHPDIVPKLAWDWTREDDNVISVPQTPKKGGSEGSEGCRLSRSFSISGSIVFSHPWLCLSAESARTRCSIPLALEFEFK